jgi:hypothetical protein
MNAKQWMISPIFGPHKAVATIARSLRTPKTLGIYPISPHRLVDQSSEQTSAPKTEQSSIFLWSLH